MANNITGVLDLFAGTGVGVACQNLEIPEHGVEINPEVVKVRELNNMTTLYRDVWDAAEADRVEFNTIWASPPCQTFSLAGTGAGRRALDSVLKEIQRGSWRNLKDLREIADASGDDRTALVLTPLHYVNKYQPTYAVWEQVPAVLPVWDACGAVLTEKGYSVWTGVLDAAEYGIAQNRSRAYLITRKDGVVASPPETQRVKTMLEEVGWGFTNRPAPTITGHVTATRSPSGTQEVFRKAILTGKFVFKPGHSPERSKVAKNGLGSEFPPDAVNYDLEDALQLQSYPRDFKLKGSKTEIQLMIGNAVPPKLAEAILKQFM